MKKRICFCLQSDLPSDDKVLKILAEQSNVSAYIRQAIIFYASHTGEHSIPAVTLTARTIDRIAQQVLYELEEHSEVQGQRRTETKSLTPKIKSDKTYAEEDLRVYDDGQHRNSKLANEPKDESVYDSRETDDSDLFGDFVLDEGMRG